MMRCVGLVAAAAYVANALVAPPRAVRRPSGALNVLGERTLSEEKVQGLDGVNAMKLASDHLRAAARHPLVEDLGDLETISISHDSYNLLKFHGSYQQDDREKRKKGAEKAWQFMLRLKVPGGEVPGPLFKVLDDLCMDYGQQDLRMTTRQAFQMHGISKANLKHTEAFSEIWCDGEKLASVQYWKRHMLDDVPSVAAFDQAAEQACDDRVQGWMRSVDGNGINLDHPVEPIYGDTYLPRKFKIGVTVEGDNSIDVYINDIGIIVLEDGSGYNVAVGGGLGRTHGKETTFARAAHEMCFVPEEQLVLVLKAIVAAQRDHGNREVRANARLKYLVHTLGEANFKSLVESYLGFELADPKPSKPWRYSDWMGWHDAGDGSLFVGINVDQGRIRDFATPQTAGAKPQLRTFLREAVDLYGVDIILSPTQSMILQNVKPGDKAAIDALMAKHDVLPIEAVDPLQRLSMACPALPLCGLAVTEAERYMPKMIERVRNVLDHVGLHDDEIMMRMTGCPNGCARPYMAELAFVGDGKASYQLVGGSPVLRGVGEYKERCKVKTMEHSLEPLFAMWRDQRVDEAEAFGDFAQAGQPAAPAADYACTSEINADLAKSINTGK
ncbi:sulfite reductase [Aureococcus anophagefferens]|nr:sulfite reductase [Aureococcus anophagefferens]